jgi:hypothetical protein
MYSSPPPQCKAPTTIGVGDSAKFRKPFHSTPFVLKPSYNMFAPRFPANARPRRRTPICAVTLLAIRRIFVPSATTAKPALVSVATQGSGWRLCWWVPPTTLSISCPIPIRPIKSLFLLCYSTWLGHSPSAWTLISRSHVNPNSNRRSPHTVLSEFHYLV